MNQHVNHEDRNDYIISTVFCLYSNQMLIRLIVVFLCWCFGHVTFNCPQLVRPNYETYPQTSGYYAHE